MVNVLNSHMVMVFLDKRANEILYKLKALHVLFTFYLEDTQQKIMLLMSGISTKPDSLYIRAEVALLNLLGEEMEFKNSLA